MNNQQQFQLAAILSYFVIGLFWYVVDEKLHHSRLVKFHIKQALNLFVFSLVFSLLSTAITPIMGILAHIPVFGWIIGGILSLILGLISLVIFTLWIIGIVKAFKEEKKYLPFIGKYAKIYLKF